MRASLYVGVVCIAVMAMAAGAALADDMFPPPWRHGTPPNATVDPGAVAVGFDSWGAPGVGPGSIMIPESMILTNPGGLSPGGILPNAFAAYASWNSECASVTQMFGRTGVLEVNYLGNTVPLSFGVANYDAGNPLKKMRVQITFADAGTGPMDFYVSDWPSNPGDPPWPLGPPFKVVDAIVKDYHDHGDGWGTRLYEIEWKPNPSYEGFGIYFGTVPGSCYIDQVIIDTLCTSEVPPIPEPAGLAALGFAGLAVRRRRRR